jgi:CheY-like chemotaxis protein
MRPEPPRILCVDDQAEMLMLLEHFLSTNGFSVATSATSGEALRLAAREQFNAVVLDYAMPGMNGAELARRLRQLYPETKLVLFTGSAQDLPESIFSLVDATLSKSFPIGNLVAVLQKLTGFSRKERRREKRYPLAATVRVVGAQESEIPALDLSGGGIGLNKRLSRPVGSELEIAVVVHSGELLLATVAEVRHVSDQRTGLALTHINEQQREAIAAFCAGADPVL